MKIKTIILSAIIMCFNLGVFSQTVLAPLIVGDDAPDLRYSKWLKGTPVKKIDKDKTYLIECWATWCGPCIAAMPHLSELAKKYKDRVTFIGLNVWEKIPDEQPYTSVLPKVTNFVENLGEKMSYNVAVDDDSRYMAKNWLARAKAPGIPTSFLIKDGKFIWIGHPNGVDSILTQVENGTYDLARYRKAHQSSIEISEKNSSSERRLMEPIDSALASKDFPKAFDLMEKAKSKMPILKVRMNMQKFNTLLGFIGEREALNFAEEWKKKDGDRMGLTIAQAIVAKTGYSKDVYLYAAKEFERGSGGSDTVNPMFYDFIATSYALANDFAKAAVAQQKAVELSEHALRDGKFSGIILNSTLTEYQDKARIYKKKSK